MKPSTYITYIVCIHW